MSKHEEFPGFTPETQAAFDAALHAITIVSTISNFDLRRAFAAFLREAMKQAGKGYRDTWWYELNAIANNLHFGKQYDEEGRLTGYWIRKNHNPPPPPPTLAKARAADLDTPAGRDVVRNFLASLGEEEQA